MRKDHVLTRPLILSAVVAVMVGIFAPGAVAQAPTLPPGAAQMLRGTGAASMAAQLRERLLQSGLTPDQIRSRLEGAGYPDSLLDAYLPGGATAGDTLAPSSSVLNAVAQLGLMDSTSVDSLIGTARIDSLLTKRQSKLADTVDTNASAYGDSLLLRRALARMRPPPDPYAFDTTADTAYLSDSLRVVRNRIRSLLADTSLTFDRKQRILRMLAPPDTTMKIFGLNLFKRGSNQFQPTLNGPVDPTYKIQPGDRLVLILTGQVEVARTVVVTREGFTVIPAVGEINVANLTLAQLEDVLYERLGRVYSGVRRGPNATTHFSVSIARLHINQVYVVGDVAQPGSYEIAGAGTALTALYVAGGPNPNGSLRRVYIRRDGKIADSLDVYDYLLLGDASHDVRLQTGDIVFVPVHGPRVVVTGEVIRPAIYEMRPGETLADALRDAGGLEPTAVRHRVQITRILPTDQRDGSHGDRQRVVIDVTAPDLDATVGSPLPLVAGDSIAVLRVDVALRSGISITGDVWTPGQIGYTPGLRLSDAIKLAGGLRPDAYLGSVLIARARSDSTRLELHASLKDSTGVPTDDLILEAHDDIRIFALHDMRPNRYVAIAGAVRKGGRFAYHDGMTVRDLVLLSGGVVDGASLREAEIARLPENRAGGVTAVTIRVPIDSTYVPARAQDPNAPRPIDPPEIPLQPYDNVLILREADWTLPRTVAVTGEVRSPGRYTLTSKTERLSDVLQRAGGETKAADPDGLVLIRRNDRVGRVGVDIQRAVAHPKSRANIIVEDGDSIFVPPFTGVVRVAGSVNSPVTVSFIAGKDLTYYVNAAGGPSTRADIGRAYVKQPDGRVEGIRHHFLFPSSVPEPRPGSEVYVPDKELRLIQPDHTVEMLAATASLLGGLVSIIYLTRH